MRQSRIVALVATGGLVLAVSACGTSGSPVALTRSVGLQLPISRDSAPATTTTITLPPTTTTPPTTAVPTTIVPAPGWSVPLATLPPGGGFTSVSCISDTFCIAAGGGANLSDASGTVGAGQTQSWDGQAWSNPSVYFPPPASGSSGAGGSPIMPAITCSGGPFCAIVDGSGFVSNGDGTNWITPVPLKAAPPLAANSADPGSGHAGSRYAAVSCISNKFCAIVDNTGNAYVWENGSWLAPQAFGTGTGGTVAMYATGRVGVSCASTSACTAVVGTSVLDWNGKTWSEETAPWSSALSGSSASTSINGDPTAISCPTSTLCAIVNGSAVSSRNGSPAWSPVQSIDPGGTLDSISCPQVTFCIAADANGSIVTWDGTSWAAPIKAIPAATNYTGIGTSVSCSSANFCMVINGDGDYATFSDSTVG